MDRTEQDGIEDRLRKQIEAYHATALAYAAVKLGLPEVMGAQTWTAQRLAAALGVSPPHLQRILNGLASLDLVEARDSGALALTETGRALMPGAASTLREKLLVVVEQYWQPWANLAACVETGAPSFDTVFGMSVGDWRREKPGHGDAFGFYLARETFAGAGPIVAALRLAGTETIAEIGGGYGGLLGAVLVAAPTARGVLFDCPHVLDGARLYLASLGAGGRVTFVPGDALRSIPVEADIYLLQSVLQQHGDAEAHTILENCRKAMGPGAALMVIEHLMPERAADDPAAIMLDLHMMAITGGRLRTQAEMEALLAGAGLKLLELAPTERGPTVLAAEVS